MPRWRKRFVWFGAATGFAIGVGLSFLAWSDPSWIGFKLAIIPLFAAVFGLVAYVSTE